MEYKQLTPDQIALIKLPLPAEAVKPHPTKTYLSSIKAIYVVERLNDVFGIGKWNLCSEIIDNKTAMIVVKSILTIPEYGIQLESYGGNDNGGENSKGHDLGDAYKGAVTDSLTKICSYLGIGMDVYKGLAIAPKLPESNGTKVANDLPWLNKDTKEFAGAVEKMRAGKSDVTKLRKFFRVSKEIETLLNQAVNN